MHSLSFTESDNQDFKSLVALLDKELAIMDGDDHAFYAQFNRTSNLTHCIVAYNSLHIAIACGAIKPFYDVENAVEIKRMYVLPEFRGQGVAKNVLAGLENWAKDLGYKYCILETGNKQQNAIRLYQSAGYAIIPNYGQYIGIENSICFRKMI